MFCKREYALSYFETPRACERKVSVLGVVESPWMPLESRTCVRKEFFGPKKCGDSGSRAIRFVIASYELCSRMTPLGEVGLVPTSQHPVGCPTISGLSCTPFGACTRTFVQFSRSEALVTFIAEQSFSQAALEVTGPTRGRMVPFLFSHTSSYTFTNLPAFGMAHQVKRQCQA